MSLLRQLDRPEVWALAMTIGGAVGALQFQHFPTGETPHLVLFVAAALLGGFGLASTIAKATAAPAASAPSEFVPLHEVVRDAYERTRGTPTAIMAERTARGDPDEIVRWYCYLVADRVSVHGNHPPAQMIEPVDMSGFEYEVERGGVVIARQQHGQATWENLSIRRSDLQPLLDGLRTENDAAALGGGGGLPARRKYGRTIEETDYDPLDHSIN